MCVDALVSQAELAKRKGNRILAGPKKDIRFDTDPSVERLVELVETMDVKVSPEEEE